MIFVFLQFDEKKGIFFPNVELPLVGRMCIGSITMRIAIRIAPQSEKKRKMRE